MKSKQPNISEHEIARSEIVSPISDHNERRRWSEVSAISEHPSVVFDDSDVDSNGGTSTSHETTGTQPTDVSDLTPKQSKILREPTLHYSAADLWQPTSLKFVSLCAITVGFLLLAVALPSLYFYSHRFHGLVQTDDKYRYFWTYVPTAVFTIAIGVWRQVDYRVKQLMPWAILRNGSSAAKKSVLLDYIDPASIVAFPSTIKNRHWPVTLVMLVTWLLTAATVLSTSLFDLQTTQYSSVERFSQIDEFDYDVPPDGLLSGGSFTLLEPSIGSTPFLTVYGIRALNLTYPFGTKDQYAFPSFKAEKGRYQDGTTITVRTEAFSSDFEACEEAKPNFVKKEPGTFRPGVVSFSTPSYYRWTSNSRLQENDPPDLDSDGKWRFTEKYFQYVDEVEIPGPPKEKSLTYHSALVFSHVEGVGPADNRTVGRSAAVICYTKYQVHPADVVLVASANTPAGFTIDSVSIINGTTKPPAEPFHYITNDQFVTGFEDSYQNTQFLNTTGTVGYSYKDKFFNIMTAGRPDLTPEALLDAKVLEKEARATYQAIYAQIAKGYLMKPSTKQKGSVQATVRSTERRLQWKIETLWMLEGVLVLMAVLCIALILVVPKNTVSRDPTSISALASITAASGEGLSILDGRGSAGTGEMEKLLEKSKFSTSVDGTGFRINREEEETLSTPAKDGSSVESKGDKEPTKFWCPLAISWWFITASMLLPLAIIGALEYVNFLSARPQGIFQTPSDTIFWVWKLVPASSLTLVGILFRCLDLNVRTIEPYQKLKRATPAVSSQSLDVDCVSKVTIVALIYSISRRQFAVMLASFSVLLVPFLSILASNLVFVGSVDISRPITARPIDWFDNEILARNTEQSLNSQAVPPAKPLPIDHPVFSGSSRTGELQTNNEGFDRSVMNPADADVSFIANFIETKNMSSPPWTYGDLTFPQLKLEGPTGSSNGTVLTIQGIHALRSVISCVPAPKEHIIKPKEFYAYTQAANAVAEYEGFMHLLVNYTYPGCKDIPENVLDWIRPPDEEPVVEKRSESRYRPSSAEYGYFGFTYDVPDTGYFGQTMILGPCEKKYAFSVLYGKTFNKTVETANMVYCAPSIQDVEVTASFRMPGYAIDTRRPPKVTRVLSQKSAINGNYTVVTQGRSTVNSSFDQFTLTLTGGLHGAASSEALLDPEVLRLTVEKIHPFFHSQHLNAFARNKINDTRILPQLFGTSLQRTDHTLRLNTIPARVLQGILAYFILCAIAIFVWSFRAKRTLTMPPTSIAGAMSLLVGTKLASRAVYPAGSEWAKSDPQLKPYWYNLTWRTAEKGNRKYTIDIPGEFDETKLQHRPTGFFGLQRGLKG